MHVFRNNSMSCFKCQYELSSSQPLDVTPNTRRLASQKRDWWYYPGEGGPMVSWQLSRCWHFSVHGVVKCLVALSQADWASDLPLVATAPAPRHPLLKHYTVQWRTVLYCAHRQSRLHRPATGQELPRWTPGITNTGVTTQTNNLSPALKRVLDINK